MVAVTPQALDGQELNRSPAVRVIPLPSGIFGAHGQSAGLLEDRQVLYDGSGLLRRRKACPQRIIGREVAIGRFLPAGKVVVEEETTVSIPEILLHATLARLRSRSPGFRFGRLADPHADLIHVCFRLVKQAVQADGSVVMGGRAVGSEAEGNVEAGFAHGAVALVVVGAETDHMLRLAIRVCHGRRKIADRDAIGRP